MNEQVAQITAPVEHMLERLGVTTVFGSPTQQDKVTVIPVAEVCAGFGYGYGFGKGIPQGAQESTEGQAVAEGGGGGGGGGGRARPVGYIRITPDGVVFKPIVDETRVALAGIATGAWAVFWISKIIRAVAKALTRRRS